MSATAQNTKTINRTGPGGCACRWLTCLQNGNFSMAIDDNVTNPPVIITYRRFHSADDAQTWSELPPLTSQWLVALGSAYTLAANTFLIGSRPSFLGNAPGSIAGLAKTTDGGTTFTCVASAAMLAHYGPPFGTFQPNRFVRVTGDRLLCFGLFLPGESTNLIEEHVLTSPDAGETWGGGLSFYPSIAGPDDSLGGDWVCIALAGGVVLAACTTFVRDPLFGSLVLPVYFRSTDGGLTWTRYQIPMVPPVWADPSAYASIRAFCRVSDSVVVAGGYANPDINSTDAFIWRSTDAGLTWSTLLIPATVGATVVALDVMSVDRQTIVANLEGGTTTKKWRVSTDGGATWDDGSTLTILGSPVFASRFVIQTARRDAGPPITMLETGAVNNRPHAEVWNVTYDPPIEMSTGWCAESVLPPGRRKVPMSGALLDCIPIFSPPACLVDCPPDPAAAAGVFVARPNAPTGFRSPLFFLGLTGGGSPTPVAGVPLGVRTDCGPTFAVACADSPACIPTST